VSEHLTTEHIEAYRADRLAADSLPYVYDHLAACESCRRLLGDAPQLRGAADNWQAEFAMAATEHIAYEKLAAYVDEKLDGGEWEAVEHHLNDCHICMREAQDLLAFSAEFASPAVRESAVERLPIGVVTKPTLWHRLFAFWQAQARGYRIALQMAAAAAAIVACVWLATMGLRGENQRLKSELAAARQNSEALQQQYEATNRAIDDLQGQLNDLQQAALENLKPENGNSQLVALKDGDGQITLDQAGNLSGLTMLPAVYQQMIKTALTSERLQAPATVAPLIQRVGILRSGASEGVAFALFSPVGTNIATERPTFRWSPVKGANHYLVAVYDENFNWVATSQPLTTTIWTAPNGLKRGATYVWQVSAMTGDKELKSPEPPAPQAKFKIIEQSRADELAQLKKSAANSHLASALIYVREGLLDDAEREFEALLRNNPKSAVSRKLFNQVKAFRGAKAAEK
jgi:hypothetical protein